MFLGEKTLVERINVTGNSITNEEVIRSELILDEGDPFTKLNLEKSILKSKILSRRQKRALTNQNNLKIIDNKLRKNHAVISSAYNFSKFDEFYYNCKNIIIFKIQVMEKLL